jgi:hypothetical protein
VTAQPPSSTPRVWNNQDIVLYHGTLDQSADSIVKSGVLLPSNNLLTRSDVDFGAGFYTATLRRQAEAWAYVKVGEVQATGQPAAPGVVEFIVSRDDLSGLDCLWFVRNEYDAEDFWSLVFNCRGGRPAHGRTTKNGWYYVVVGPMAAFWRQRVAFQGYDQVSFHTGDAVRVLNRAQKSRVV